MASGMLRCGRFLIRAKESPYKPLEEIARRGERHSLDSQQTRASRQLDNRSSRSTILLASMGRAILNRNHDSFLTYWNLDLTTREKRERFAHTVDMTKQSTVEIAVTAHIQARMSVAVISYKRYQNSTSDREAVHRDFVALLRMRSFFQLVGALFGS